MTVDHLLAPAQQAVLERIEQPVGLRREHLGEACARRGHSERVPVERADLVDLPVLDGLEGLLGAADRAGREPAAERLGERQQIGSDAEALDRAARGDAEPRLDLVEDQQHPEALRQLAHGLEVAGLGKDHPEVHHRRLHDHAGRRAALLEQPLDPPLHRAGVVERDGDGQVGDRLRDPGAVGERRVVLAVADLPVGDAD